jgi:hypothetical protein
MSRPEPGNSPLSGWLALLACLAWLVGWALLIWWLPI